LPSTVISQREPVCCFISRIAPRPFHRHVSLADIIVHIGQLASALESAQRHAILGPERMHLLILLGNV
jgi:hypothetical protein